MKIYDFPYYGILPEVDKKIIEKLLDHCDEAEYISARIDGINSVDRLKGTPYENMAGAFLFAYDVNEYGARRKAFRFELTEIVKAHIVEKGLLGILYDENNKILLEDLALYRGKNKVFYCISHEGINELFVDEDNNKIENLLKQTAVDEMKKTPLYSEMARIADKLKQKTPESLKKEWQTVFDLHCYVDEEKQLFIHQPPQFPCEISEYKKIAKNYLTKQTFSKIKNIESFAQLHPIVVPTTAEEAMAMGFSPDRQYISSEYYQRVAAELSVLREILEIGY